MGSGIKRLFLSGLSALIVFMAGCGRSQAVYDEFVDIPRQAWPYSLEPEFKVRILDSSKPYELTLNTRLTGEYAYSSLLLSVEAVSPGLEGNARRLELVTADSDGRWLGKRAGALYNYQLTYEDSYKFPDTGTFVFRVKQHIRQNPLRGVDAIGLTVSAQ